MLAVIILSVILVIFDKVSEKQYPVLIFFTCLGLVYQLSLISNYIVGTDIHYEYYFALQTYNTGHWDSTLNHSYNSAVSISVFIPMLARFLHIPLEWAFKIVPPLFLSGIPVAAYYIFKKEFDSKAAFLATFFLIAVPTMFLELSGLAKQAIGELFLILCLGLIAYNVFNLRWKRYVLIGILGLLTVVSHYSMGGTLFCYMAGALGLFIIGKYIIRSKLNINLGYLAITIVVVILLGLGYYGWVAKGAALVDIMGSASYGANNLKSAISSLGESKDTAVSIQVNGTTSAPVISDVPDTSSMAGDITSPTRATHWNYPEPAVALALGIDFGSADLTGKIFRIFQYLTEILIIAGMAHILWNYRRYSSGYLAFIILSGALLTATVFYPGFSPLFNASRFYNLVLIFAAPAIIVGGKLILRNYKVVVIGVLIPYFIFTSGAVFELLKIDNVTSLNLPYSHALSAYRTDSTAIFTENDIKARNWVKDNNKFPVYGDLWGSTAMAEVKTNLGDKSYVNYFIDADTEVRPRDIPDDCYILLRERNIERQDITSYTGVGMRTTRTFADMGFYDILSGRQIIFKSGNAAVYGPKEK
jgi:uncharacterized membrane protein